MSVDFSVVIEVRISSYKPRAMCIIIVRIKLQVSHRLKLLLEPLVTGFFVKHCYRGFYNPVASLLSVADEGYFIYTVCRRDCGLHLYCKPCTKMR